MNNEEFKSLLNEVFNTHMFMQDRDYHTINELMHCLRYDDRFKDFNFNISVITKNDEWWSIPTIDTFITLDTLGIWFDDDKIEYEQETMDNGGYLFTWDCITIYEREEK